MKPEKTLKQISLRPNGTKRVQSINPLPTRTQQQFKQSCDVNHIMARYKQTGTITHIRNAEQGVYMDLTNISDLAAAKIQIQRAENAFQEIPASIRQKFDNDPAKLISYLSNPSNNLEAAKLGLIKLRDESNDAQPPQDPPASSNPSK